MHSTLNHPHGLVLLHGTVASGRTTTLNTILNEANKQEGKRVIAIQTPTPYTNRHPQPHLTLSDIRPALRMRPDTIIILDELRDVQAVKEAIQAAETGHLVYAEIHASTPEQAIKRIISLYKTEEQPRIKETLTNSLKALISHTRESQTFTRTTHNNKDTLQTLIQDA